MKLSLVLAAVALADPGLAGAVTAAPEITGVINHGPRQPFKPLPKNGTTHGLVNATGLAVPTGGPVRGVWRPFADKPIEALDCSESVAAASMTAGPASQGAPSSAQVPFKKVSKGKRDMFEKAARESGGDSGHAEGTGTDKKKSTAPHQINSLSADFVTKSLGGKKPWTRSSSGVPKNAGRKFKEALAAKNAKASPQAPWTKKVDHGKGSSSSSQSDRKAKTSTGTPKVHGRKFKEAPAAKKGKATGNRPVSSTTVHNGKGKTTSHQHSAGQTRTKRPSSVSHNHNHLPTGKKTKIPRRSLANTPETISADNTPQPIHRRTSDTPFGIKKGLVYKNGAVTPSFSRDGSATWAYNWGAAPGAPMFQQIPMYWGPRNKGDAAGVMERVREGAPWVLGYNEPDMVWRGGGGCEVSAREAYDAWGIDMFPFYNEGARLVCPAITSWNSTQGATNGPSGLVWLHEFVGYTTKTTDLLCGAQALHWYGIAGISGAEQAELFMAYIALAHDEINALFGFEMPLWITEFAAMPVTDAQVMADFLDVVLPWLDGQAYVERYSPFMADNMVDPAGQQLNVAGEKFVTWKGGAV